MTMKNNILCRMVIICGFLPLLFFDATEATDADRDADMIWRGLDDSRQRLISGVFTLSGATAKHGETREENCLVAFDTRNGFYRFDRIGIANSLSTNDYYFECWSPGSHRAAIERQPYSTMSMSSKIDLFDIRMLGFFTFFDSYNNLRYDENTIAKFFRNKTLVDYVLHENGIATITLEVIPKRALPPGLKNTRQIYWINPSQGFSLVKVEYRHGDGDVDTTEITWKEKNNVWVPETARFSTTQTPNFSGVWKFDWSLVNEDVPSRLFEVSDLSEEPVALFSRELGESIQIGMVGGGEELLFATEFRRSSPHNRILLWIGICLIIIALGKKLYDYWRASTSA